MTKHWLRNGKVYCDGATIAECHVYPDCDCEYWGEDCAEAPHERVQHQECWKLAWINAGFLSDTFDENYWPPEARGDNHEGPMYPDGEIHIDWEGEWCTWGYVEVAK